MPATPPQTLADQSACYVCLGIGLGDAFMLALWDTISQNAGGETFFLLIQPGDRLLVQAGDRFLIQ